MDGSRKRKRPVKERPKAPRGFVTFAGKDQASRKIDRRLEDTQAALESFGIEGDTKVHSYTDGTIDGELVIAIGRGMSGVDAMRKLEVAFGMDNERGLWFQVGARFAVREGEEKNSSGVVDRRKGLDEVTLYWRRMFAKDDQVRTGIFGDAFGTMQHVVIPSMEDKYGRKTDSIFVRLHWNPDHEKPNR